MRTREGEDNVKWKFKLTVELDAYSSLFLAYKKVAIFVLRIPLAKLSIH